MGVPDSIYCDEGSEFTNKKFLQLLDTKNIKIIYATNHAPFVESFNRTMKRMMDRYMEFNELTTWTNIYRIHWMQTIILSTAPHNLHQMT